jgi:uncharacterized protein (DUF885 family)
VETVAQVSQRFVDDFAGVDPDEALGSFGVGETGTKLTDYSPAGSQARLEMLRAARAELDRAQTNDEADRLGRLFLATTLESELAHLESAEPERALQIIGGPPSSVRMVFDLAAHSDEDDWEALSARLAAVPAAMSGYRQNLSHGLERGHPGARRCALAVAQQCATWSGADGDSDTSGGFYRRFVRSYGTGPQAGRLAALAVDADRSYGELATWLRSEYAPQASETDGVGEERYQMACKLTLGTVPDLAEAYEWGVEELGRLEREKALESERIVPGASSQEVLEQLNSNPDMGLEGLEAWRAFLQETTDSAIESLAGSQFDIAPPLRRCEVSIPPEGSAAAPYYTPPNEELTTPGRIWFPVLGRSWFTTWDIVTTVFHESVPGHHLQLGSTRLVPLTRAQKLGFNSAHGEGWALYAERLMDELGHFERPEQRLGFLCAQAFRAARVVIDIGLHTGRPIPSGWPGAGEAWSYGRAVDALERAAGDQRAFCESEVLRYLGWPSQAISYKLGERCWLAGREAARHAAGPAFDLKDWHARALALGALGLDDLGRELAALSSRAA